jgi:small subunit ribosomal protein S6e
MANFKVVISDPKSKRAFQKEIEQNASGLMGRKIGDKVKGDPMGFQGYEFQVTGGSDAQGFPMRKDVDGLGRKRLLISHGPGFHPEHKGQRRRKSIRGNTVSASIAQVNVKIVAHGTKPIEQLSPKEKKEEKPAEEKPKEDSKKEEKSDKAEKPAKVEKAEKKD